MDLANYKKVWKDQPEERNKVSSCLLYTSDAADE